MRTSRIILVILVVAVVVLVALYALGTEMSSSSSSSTWRSAAGYPLQVNGDLAVAGQQCWNSTTYVYCAGGEDANSGPRSELYSSSSITASSSNITSWTLSASQYPKSIDGQSCVFYSGHVYCVGGMYDDNQDDVASSYYATSSGAAVGTWNSTTAYPIPIDSQSCVTSSGYIYCVGGSNETDGTNADSASSNSVWYAQLSSSGIGSWNRTTAYPENLFFPDCVASGGYVYCVGGADGNNNPQSAVYFASLSPSGVGGWTKTTAYPIQASGQACVISSGIVYCVGGEEQSNSFSNSVYYASVSSEGIGTWKQAPNYPASVATTCVESSDYMYCVGGFDSSSVGENNAVYYAPLASLSAAATG